MQEFLRFIRFVLVGLVFVLIASSCLDQEINGYEEEAQQKIDNFLAANGYTDAQHIGYGIYVKMIEVGDDTFPKVGQTILINYTGKYTNNTVFETTDIDQSGYLTYKDFYIYGQKRHKVGTMIYGFDTAVRKISQGAKAQFVIPHQYAFGNYEPVVYNVELLKVIEDDSTYEADLFDEFKEVNGFYDSLIAPGLYYKLADGDTSLNLNPNVKAGDTIQMKLTARYAEVDGITAATPLGLFKFEQITSDLPGLLTGNISGSLGGGGAE